MNTTIIHDVFHLLSQLSGTSQVSYYVDPDAVSDDGTLVSVIFGFTTNAPTLIVLDNRHLDRETQAVYNFTVYVNGSNGMDSTTVIINLTDENDQIPYLTNTKYVMRNFEDVVKKGGYTLEGSH